MSRHRGGIILSLLVAAVPSARFAYADYVESYQTWSATSADTWQVQDLSGAPYNVPANAVVEVAVRNSRAVAAACAPSAPVWIGVSSCTKPREVDKTSW